MSTNLISTYRNNSVLQSPGRNDERLSYNSSVFDRLSQSPKRETNSQIAIPPDPCFKLEYTNTSIGTKPPTPVNELTFYLDRVQCKRKLFKKRHESPVHARLDDLLKEKRIIENMKRTLGFHDHPMQIRSVVTGDIIEEESFYTDSRYYIPKIGKSSPTFHRRRQMVNKSVM